MAVCDLTPAELDFVLYRGDSADFEMSFVDEDTGDPLELPTEGWLGQIRPSKASDEVTGEITVTATDAESGVIVLGFPALNVGTYVYDLECSEGEVRTWVSGRITVSRDVSHD